MERLRQVKIMVALTVLCFFSEGALGASPKAGKPAPRKRARTKSVNILLQEGLYAEETEGDLDKAIGIYEEVVEKASYYQRIAARATYRLGLCYLKKGWKDQAAEYFQQVVANFPSQNVLVKRATEQLGKIRPSDERVVDEAVMTISTCAEGDARVAKALESIRGLDENVVVGELVKFLDSKTNTVRRSAIYILWKGSLRDISAAVPKLQEFCAHEEDFTRGMAAIALGAAKVNSGFETLCNMTLKDSSGYARRCAAYALGLLGRADAKPTLEKALKDSDPLVRNNAEAALKMLSESPMTKFSRPVVISTVPTNYANDVSPELSKISVTFDQPMADKSWSWVRWNYLYPQTTGKPNYDLTKTTCTLPVKLEPGKAYFVRINAEPYMSFRSSQGISAQPYVLVFATKDKSGSLTPIPEDMLAKAKEINSSVPPQPYTQELQADIKPDGTINFKTTIRMTNEGSSLSTTTFINSDFVNVTAMYDDKGKPLKFTTTREGNHYRYHVTFNKPVLPGEMMVYSHEGTMTGLIKPVPGSDDSFHYYMRHYPSAGRPTLRRETFLLPEGAELVSTTPPDMKRGEKSGRIELHVEEIIPPGGALTTAFQYKLTGAMSPQFTSKIYDNTALDLDTGAAVPLGTEWPDNLEIAWDNDGGGAIMVKKKQSKVKFITLPGVKKGIWADALSTARNSIGVLKASTSSGVLANQTNFIAVLTSEGNLAVVEIGDHDPQQAEITWRLEKPTIPSEPPKLNRVPWVDGEIMRLDLKTMAGMNMGELIYTAEAVEVKGEKLWRIESYLSIIVSYTQQYTRVDADLDSFSPVFGRTRNQLGDFIAHYEPDKVDLTTITTAGKREQQINLDSAVYDNEQALYLIRRLPLSENYSTAFSIFPVQSAAVSECRIKVTGKEQVSVSAGTFDCYAIELTVYAAAIKALEHHLWISADGHQYLVKYDSGQAIMELKEVGLKAKAAKKIELPEHALSFELPADWYKMESPTMGMYILSLQLIGPQMDAWGLLTGAEHGSFFASARDAADMDIEVLKGTFKNYTVRENSWKDLTVDTTSAVNFHADYLDKNKQMVEYRTYILGKSLLYWFVFRIEKDKFEENKARFDSIVSGFKLNRKAIRKKKLDAEDLSSKGWRLYNQQKFTEAEELFQQAVTHDPSLANAWNGLGWSQFKQGKNLNAKASFEKCLEIEPAQAGALNGLAWIAKGEGKTDEAIGYWEKAVEALPSATAALSGLTTTYMELKEYDKAIKYYKIWLRAEPDNADVKAGLQEARLKAGKTRG